MAAWLIPLLSRLSQGSFGKDRRLVPICFLVPLYLVTFQLFFVELRIYYLGFLFDQSVVVYSLGIFGIDIE